MGLSYTAFIGYGYIINNDEVDMDKYEYDLYDRTLFCRLEEWGGPYFYGVRLKTTDLEYNVEQVSRFTQEDLRVTPEVKRTVIENFQKDFPHLKDKKPCLRLLPHIW